MSTLIHFAEKRYAHIPAYRKTRAHGGRPHAAPVEAILPSQSCLLDYRARIDNIQELAHTLGLDAFDAKRTDLPTLITMAYERWRDDMFRHIRGDWWFAFWDAQRQAVILAVDPGSPTTLFYAWTRAGRLAFSSSVADILEIDGISSDLHESRMLSYLITWGPYRDFLQTEYKTIRQIGSGTFTCFTARSAKTTCYWHPTQFHERQDCSPEEYVEEFLRRYRQAVIARLPAKGSVASMLSAGLDSGSVTALAAEYLSTENRTLHAYTHVPIKAADNLQVPGKLLNEWPAASELAAMYPNIKHVAVDSAQVNPIHAATFMLKQTGRMQAAHANAAWIHHLYQSVRRDGSDILLTGQAGNIVVSWEGAPINIWNLLLRKEWQRAFRYLASHGQKGLLGMSRQFAGDTLRYLQPARAFPPARFTPKRTAIAHPQLYQRWQRPFEEDARQYIGTVTSHRVLRNHAYPMLASASSFGQSVACAFGITACDPTSDQDVVEWCLQVPDAQYRNEVQSRLLIRNAMRGLLPENTRNSRIRGLQPADLGYRYRQYRESVEHILSLMQSSPAVGHYLNLPQITQNWHLCQKTMQADNALFDFHTGLQAGLFFLMQEGKISMSDFPLGT